MATRFGRLARIRAQKRWQWCGIMHDDVAVGMAIVRTGYAANVFFWVFDRRKAEFLQDTSRVLPSFAVDVADTPASGCVARYTALVEQLEITRDRTRWRIEGRVGDGHIDVEFDEQATPCTAICPAGDDRLNTTRKQALATATGVVRVGTERFRIDGAHALLDHSHGMLAGETIWQWAIGAGAFTSGGPVGFNLVASFNDGLENAIWLDGEPTSAGLVEFEIPEDHNGLWRVFNDRVDLSMHPEALRAQELDLGVVASDYLQPLGEWHGTIDGRELRALGVAELHRSVW